MNLSIANIKINKLCKMILTKDTLKEEDLIAIGFNKEEIEELITENIIFYMAKEFYFIDVALLEDYGNHLQKINIDLAQKVYERCLKIDNRYRHAKLKLLNIYLRKHDKNKIFEILENLINNDTEDNLKDDFLYLKLLTAMYQVPKNLQDKAKSLIIIDILIKGNNPDLEEINDIRKLAFCQRYRKALIHLKNNPNLNIMDTNYLIFRELLFQILWMESQRDFYIVDCIKDNNYEEIVRILKREAHQHSLSKFSELILALAHVYLNLKQTGYIIPVKKDIEIQTTYDAYRAYDYKKALELTLKEDEKMGFSKNITAMILKDICYLIDFYENKPVSNEEEKYYYGIPNSIILKIKQDMASGKNYESLGAKYGLNAEELDIVILVMAQECYSNGQIALGEEYLQMILNKENITTHVNYVLAHTLKIIKKVRKTYQTRTLALN